MPTNALYDAWSLWLRQFLPNERITRLRTAAAFLYGLFESKSVHLSDIAAELPGDAVLLSQERRLRRWLENPACNVKRWYASIAQWWLAWSAEHEPEVTLLVDGSKVSGHHQLLMVALALPHGRALPIAWTWVDTNRGASSRSKQLALLARVRNWLPPCARQRVVLAGDCEFGSVAVIQQVSQGWGWGYVLRQKSNTHMHLTPPPAGAAKPRQGWQHCAELAPAPGALRCVPQALLTYKHAFATTLVGCWRTGDKEPWLLASSFADAATTVRYYSRRMLIEEMFADLKDNGFDLEATRLQHVHRLGRLVLMVCLAYVWLLRTGLELLIARLTHLVDRNDRRDLSLFQLGARYAKRLLNNHRPLCIRLCPDGLYDRWPGDQPKLSGT